LIPGTFGTPVGNFGIVIGRLAGLSVGGCGRVAGGDGRSDVVVDPAVLGFG
jgi:hypothetical protein